MKIHFIGIDGVGMSFLAKLCEDFADVDGSDIKRKGHKAEFVAGADLVVKSMAITDDNPEIVEAKKEGLPIVDRASLLGVIMDSYGKKIAVSGTHGKTTATAMIAYALRSLEPTAAIGGSIGGKVGIVGKKKVFVAEACEYKRSFLHLNPTIGVILNADFDHVDYYRSLSDVQSAFREFADKCETALIGEDIKRFGIKGRKQTLIFGFTDDCDYVGKIDNDILFLLRNGVVKDSVRLKVRGKHNYYDALAALAVADFIGVKGSDGLCEFSGVDRRTETIGAVGGVTYISDYAHHPVEIECTLRALKESYQRTAVVFQPHTYSRTVTFYKEIAAALKLCDKVMVLPVYAARENFVEGVDRLVPDAGGFMFVPDFEALYSLLGKETVDYDAVIFMGAGDVDDFAREYVAKLLANVDTGKKM
ncbi:MAG: UDP-N-acetylmuramate--L-alanine ligase [Acutalibacteraceae bacterium]